MADTPTRSSHPAPFLLPLFIFLIIASRYPDLAGTQDLDLDPSSDALAMTSEMWTYLVMLGVQVVVAAGLIIYFRKSYLAHFPLRISPLSVVIGVVGVVLWIGICHLRWESSLLSAIGFDLERPSFNPFMIGDSSVRALFFVLRFTVLAMLVPIIEELFVRGWLVRWIDDPNFERVDLRTLSIGALLAASAYGVLTHPTEAIAAFLWFGLITWLARRTGNLWDCVVAHAVTNLLLGLYVLKTESWHLW